AGRATQPPRVAPPPATPEGSRSGQGASRWDTPSLRAGRPRRGGHAGVHRVRLGGSHGALPRRRGELAWSEQDAMIEPFRLAFDLRAPQDHAFDVYTRDIDRWWPASHTQTGRSALRIVIEGG